MNSCHLVDIEARRYSITIELSPEVLFMQILKISSDSCEIYSVLNVLLTSERPRLRNSAVEMIQLALF